MKTTILSADHLRQIVRRVGLDRLMDETIGRLTEACAGLDARETVVPARAGFSYNRPDLGLLEWMPGMATGAGVQIKVVGYHPGNGRSHGLPTVLSTLSTYSVESGRLMGLMDATLVTAMRTGAASAVASRILADPESSSLGIIGCGAQAVTQLHALSRVFPLRRVYVHDTDPVAVASFQQRIHCLGLDAVAIVPAPVHTFLDQVDMLCTATSVGVGEGPVFEDGPLRPHVHVNAIGSDFPGKIELPEALLRRALVCPDFTEQALKEGECQRLEPRALGPDLPTLVKEQACHRRARDGLTVFDSTGWAVEDMVSMALFMEHAAALGIGAEVQVESVSSDYRHPYQFLYDAPAGEAGPSPDGRLKRVV